MLAEAFFGDFTKWHQRAKMTSRRGFSGFGAALLPDTTRGVAPKFTTVQTGSRHETSCRNRRLQLVWRRDRRRPGAARAAIGLHRRLDLVRGKSRDHSR